MGPVCTYSRQGIAGTPERMKIQIRTAAGGKRRRESLGNQGTPTYYPLVFAGEMRFFFFFSKISTVVVVFQKLSDRRYFDYETSHL